VSPAADAATRTALPQEGQENWRGELAVLGLGAPFHFGVSCCGEAVVAAGIGIRAPQWGHFPFFPALAAGTLSFFAQLAQENWIGPPAGAPPLAGTCEVGLAAAGLLVPAKETLGICTLVPQCGHLPLRPAVSSGVRIRFPHPGQWNSMGMKGPLFSIVPER
jgi:hypothetical protein